jgi:hypothetical protein
MGEIIMPFTVCPEQRVQRMASYDLKRGFNRIFVVLTVVWVLWCAYLPIYQCNQFIDTFGRAYLHEEAECTTSECREAASNARMKMYAENTIGKWYRMEWWFVLFLGVGVPPLVYWSICGLTALLRWIGRGFKR